MASKEAPAFRHGEGSHIRGSRLAGVAMSGEAHPPPFRRGEGVTDASTKKVETAPRPVDNSYPLWLLPVLFKKEET